MRKEQFLSTLTSHCTLETCVLGRFPILEEVDKLEYL